MAVCRVYEIAELALRVRDLEAREEPGEQARGTKQGGVGRGDMSHYHVLMAPRCSPRRAIYAPQVIRVMPALRHYTPSWPRSKRIGADA